MCVSVCFIYHWSGVPDQVVTWLTRDSIREGSHMSKGWKGGGEFPKTRVTHMEYFCKSNIYGQSSITGSFFSHTVRMAGSSSVS